MEMLLEIIIAAAMVLGTFLMFVAAVGLVRLPDVFCRMHAAGKAGTLGVSLLLLGPVIWFIGTDTSMAVRGLIAIFFQFITTPAATHVLSRASYIADYPLTDRTAVDELQSFMLSRPDELYGEE